MEVDEPVVGQNAVLPHQRHDVRGDAHHQQVHQRTNLLEGHVVLLGIGLNQLEAHPAARQLVEGVGAVDPLGVQYSHGLRYFVGREMVVADDEIHAFLLRIDYFFRGFDATVQRDDESYALAGRMVDSLDGYAVAFGIPVGNVERQVLVSDVAEELVDQRHGRAAVDVVVAVDHDFLMVADGLLDARDRLVHVLHQEGVMEVGQARFEELLSLLKCVYASLYE